MSLVEGDRRADPRVELVRPCKIYDPRGLRYIGGTTWNVSTSGMLLAVDRPLELKAGDRLFVGIAVKRRDCLLARREMLEAVVQRSARTARDETAIALKFEARFEVPTTNGYRRAA